MNRTHAVADFYRTLRVSPGASVTEIKASYRKLAMQLHPDRHDGCPDKSHEFKRVTEAYTILMDQSQRHSYDFESGHASSYNNKNRQRKTAPRADYRKVYAPRPPPSWKRTWDHNRHKTMHYGDGFQDEAIDEAIKTAKQNGAFDYQSPLGKGFEFNKDNADDNYNPYSKKSPQGPKKIIFEYEEGTINNKAGGGGGGVIKTMRKRERVVSELHNQRTERQVLQAEKLRKQQQRYNSAFAVDESDQCIIL